MRLYDGWGASDFNAAQAVSSQINNRGRSAFDMDARDGKSINVVGINATKVDEMIAGIEEEVNKIYTQLEDIDPTADQTAAFLDETGQVGPAVIGYIEKVKEYCHNLVSDIRAFEDKLVDVRTAYQENMQKMSEAINNNATNNSVGEEYQRQL